MKLTCYLIDDEPHALELLETYIQRTPGLTLTGKNTDPLAGLQALSGATAPDLLFLDIDMPALSGLQLAGLLKGRCQVIFTTAHRDHGPEAFDLRAVDYLLKPIFYDRFLKAVQKAGPQTVQLPGTLLVKTGTKGQLKSLAVADIFYAATALNYLEIWLSGGQRVVTYLTLNELLEKLPESFSRIHKSYLVNHSAIGTLEYGQLRLKDGTVLPVGRVYRSAFREKLQDLVLVSKRDPGV